MEKQSGVTSSMVTQIKMYHTSQSCEPLTLRNQVMPTLVIPVNGHTYLIPCVISTIFSTKPGFSGVFLCVFFKL